MTYTIPAMVYTSSQWYMQARNDIYQTLNDIYQAHNDRQLGAS